MILTAAYCFKSDSRIQLIATKKILVAFGRYDIRDWTEENAVMSDVEKIIVHSDYLSTKESELLMQTLQF